MSSSAHRDHVPSFPGKDGALTQTLFSRTRLVKPNSPRMDFPAWIPISLRDWCSLEKSKDGVGWGGGHAHICACQWGSLLQEIVLTKMPTLPGRLSASRYLPVTRSPTVDLFSLKGPLAPLPFAPKAFSLLDYACPHHGHLLCSEPIELRVKSMK